jgi:hypothetical protein
MALALNYLVLIASILPIVTCVDVESLAAVHLDDPQARKFQGF